MLYCKKSMGGLTMLKEKGFYKGVNFGGWLSQCNYEKEHLDTFITENDFSVADNQLFITPDLKKRFKLKNLSSALFLVKVKILIQRVRREFRHKYSSRLMFYFKLSCESAYSAKGIFKHYSVPGHHRVVHFIPECPAAIPAGKRCLPFTHFFISFSARTVSAAFFKETNP